MVTIVNYLPRGGKPFGTQVTQEHAGNSLVLDVITGWKIKRRSVSNGLVEIDLEHPDTFGRIRSYRGLEVQQWLTS
jgi:hypothetical protein